MNYCRHCQKPTIEQAGPCPHCGQELGDAVQTPSGDEIELDTSSTSSGGRTIDPATGEITDEHSGEDALDLGELDGDSIELGIDPDQEREQKAQPAVASTGGSGTEAGRPGQTPSPLASQADAGPDEIAQVAGFGQPPESFLKTASYMFHVRKRRKILEGEIAGIEKERQAALDDLNADLLNIGTRKEKEARQEGDFGRQVEDIHEAKSRLSRFREEQDIEDRDRKGKQSYIDEEISRLEVEASKFRNEEDIVAKEAEDAFGDKKRIQLKMQRVEIEIRNIKQQIPKPKKDEPPIAASVLEPYEKQIAERQDSLKEIKVELEKADQVVKDINRKLAIARNAVSEHMGKISLANKKKSAVLDDAKKSEQASQQKFYSMQEELEEKFRQLARAALDAENLPDGYEDMAKVVKDKTAKEAGLQAKLALYGEAIESYSHSDYNKGFILLGGIGGLVLILLILILLIAL